MFFNKLKEEIREEFSEKMAIMLAKLSTDVTAGILAGNNPTEELIKKYEHTQWKDLGPFEEIILTDRFNLVSLIGNLAIYKGPKITFADWHYVGDTLIKVKERQEERTAIKKEVERSFSEKYLPPMVADINGNTMKFSDFKAIEEIKSILKNQKSTVKAVKEIKAVLKDVE